MQDPCNPTPHHATHALHHPPSGQVDPQPVVHAVPHHPQGHVLGRIRRHGTHRIARRLHALAGACPAGPPLTIGMAMLKTVAPAAAFAGLTTIASGLKGPAEAPSSEATGLTGSGPGGSPAALGVAPHKQGHQHQPPVSVPEPPSLTLLLLVTIGWIGLRVGLRRPASRQA